MTDSWNLKKQMLDAIAEKGGWVNCHAHFDKAFYITKAGLDKSMVDMEVKWQMSDDIKRASSQEQMEERIRTALDILVNQGCKLTCTFVDAYGAVGHKAIDAANKVKEEYKDKIKILTISQPIGGVLNKAEREIYESVTAKCDIVGGLPSKDRPNDKEAMDVIFGIAKNLNKPLHVHIDQENNPNERDTEKLVAAIEKHGYQGRAVAVHAISVSAQPKEYRKEIYKKMADVGMAVAVCPSAALSMRQLDQYQAPAHNSIANIPEMLDAGVTVGMGVDNVCDFYQPFLDADFWVEMRMLQEACRFYDFDALVKIATENGQKLLGIS
ncbi:MAG: amidohydrolase family protein [Candidatus Liptonbacteria bacterium]|nr:amidohydrolase family protein [Candidatus Liptonbacteria bacterium]